MQTIQSQVFTPSQVANMLQLNKNTVYELIKRGEIIAKKIGKVFRIPASSVSFALTGLDYDLYQAEKVDLKNIKMVRREIDKSRKA
ncbi:MAG: helix-turn-helix domain-containing protein [Candidatus Beckwithbacteria bacterium]|nr:helix-turn-helix domain-containing protein [Patescibacteria group bacterium]